MTIPTLTNLAPTSGPSSGGDLVRLSGSEFAEHVSVHFGEVPGRVLSVLTDSGAVNVRTPAHLPSTVDVILRNLDSAGVPVPGETATLPQAYRFLRPRLVKEADLTRVVRTLLRMFKKQLLENTSISVSVDYDDTVVDGLNIVAMSKLPSLVLSGPRLAENRFFSSNTLREEIVSSATGPEIVRHKPPFTTDLAFTITVASDRTVELLNLMAAVASFLNRNRWLEIPRESEIAESETVRYEMDPTSDFRTTLDGPDDVRAFTCGLIVRGFDVDEGLPLDIGRAVDATQLETEPMPPGGAL